MANFYGELAHQVGIEGDSSDNISDVDSAELAKLVEDIDDLDAGLFGSSNKKPGKQSTVKPKSALKSHSADEGDKQQKSHVTFDSPDKSFSKKKSVDFGDFDADDPLGDLLSDEDDDFGKKNKKTDVSKGSGKESTDKWNLDSKSKQNKAKVIAELFGINEDKEQDSKPSVASLQFPKEPEQLLVKKTQVTRPPVETPDHTEKEVLQKPLSARRRAAKVSGAGDDDDGGDLLSGMGFDTEKSNQPKSKLNELLGKSTSSNTDSAPKSILDDILGANPSNKERMAAGDSRRSNPHQTQAQPSPGNVSFGSYSPSVTNPGRRSSGRRNSGTPALPDPLGIFTPTPSPTKEVPARQSLSSSPGNKSVDWLGISDTSTAAMVVASGSPDRGQGDQQSLPDWLAGGVTSVTKPAPPAPQVQAETRVSTPATVPLQPPAAVIPGSGNAGVLVAGSQIDQQVISALQHQETQLLTALHLKQHEERLSSLQVRQQEILQHQEKQLEELIRRQMQRQEQLELQMRSQQERIGAHIQMLLTQPVTNPVIPIPRVPSTDTVTTTGPVENKTEQISADHIQAEKKQLESALESLQAKHLEELQLLEDSYKRQISILENSCERQEQRLRAENERLEKEYQARITRIQKEQENLIEQHQLRLLALQREQLEELQQLREVHRLNLEEAHKQHSDMLEHLSKARSLESEALKEASSYSRSLHTALDQLGRNSQDISGLQVELSSQHHGHLDTREAALQAREAELKVARESLEKQRTASEEERKRLVGLVAQLEQKLAEQRQLTEEEQWNLRQERIRLEAASKALEKERERTNQQFDWERQQLQEMKESMMSEQKLLSEKLQAEKLSVASEKSRLETLSKLHGTATPDVLKLRAELEAGMKVAEEASRQAETERDKLRTQQNRLDADRRRLEDYERELSSRARDLETLTNMAVATKEEGRRALEEARRIELQHSERSTDIQRQLVELREREKRLAQEKVILSQERLSLQHEKERLLCSHCRRPAGIPISPPPTPPDLDKRYVNPKALILRLAAEDEASRLEEESRFYSSHMSASK